MIHIPKMVLFKTLQTNKKMNYDTNNTTAWTKNRIITFPKLQPQYDFNQLKLLIIKITGYSCFQAVVIYVEKYFLRSCVM